MQEQSWRKIFKMFQILIFSKLLRSKIGKINETRLKQIMPKNYDAIFISVFLKRNKFFRQRQFYTTILGGNAIKSLLSHPKSPVLKNNGNKSIKKSARKEECVHKYFFVCVYFWNACLVPDQGCILYVPDPARCVPLSSRSLSVWLSTIPGY